MIELITTHPAKFTGSIFIVLWLIGILTVGNKWFSRIAIPAVVLSGGVWVLTLIWSAP